MKKEQEKRLKKKIEKSKIQPLYKRRLSRKEPADEISPIIQDLLLSYPEELQEEFDTYNKQREHPKTDPGYSLVEFIFQKLEKEAKRVLRDNGYPTDLGELLWIDGHTEMDIVNASAKQVLFSIYNLSDLLPSCTDCKEMIDKNEIERWQKYLKGKRNIIERAIIETIKLISASIKIDGYKFLKGGLDSELGKRTSHKPKILIGIVRAIHSVLEKNPKLTAQEIWNRLLKHKKDSPYIIEQHEMYINKDEEKIVHKDKTKRGIEFEDKIVFNSFRRYVRNVKHMYEEFINSIEKAISPIIKKDSRSSAKHIWDVLSDKYKKDTPFGVRPYILYIERGELNSIVPYDKNRIAFTLKMDFDAFQRHLKDIKKTASHKTRPKQKKS